MPNPYKYIDTDTIGKLAKKYYTDSKTFKIMIGNFPALNTKVMAYLQHSKKAGCQKIPPILIDEIIQTLGNPQTLFL